MKFIRELYSLVCKCSTLVSPRLNTILRYYATFRSFPNLKNPQTFNEKMLKLKLENYNNNPLVKQCADKYAVREFVESRGLGKILIPLIAAYNKVDDIRWDKLPSRFVIKWNFGCRLNMICKDKSTFNISVASSTLKRWKSQKYYLWYSEMQYKLKESAKKIIVEEFLDNGTGDSPEDYKVYCYNGKPLYILCCFNRRGGVADYVYFDLEWNFVGFDIKNQVLPKDVPIEKPQFLDEMLDYASILSKGFPFVRADFYIVKNKVYFGELTFTPCGCMDAEITQEANMILGKNIIV